ncbi:hypothetical protein DH2020_007506 [Rehmannia glutinosa]|uniref:HVA22-like protein n=1 Tax=Rehmannia glutinosa TaxID=99300 RepID=A0ABR0TYG1_REHGL
MASAKMAKLVFGYVYPAYECYKTVEMNKPDIDQLRFWCQYWYITFAIYPPDDLGTTYVYDSFFRPYVAKHEPEIDRNLLELRLRAGDMAVSYWQRAASYGQTRIFDILQYIASQSTPPRPAQGTRVQKPNVPSNLRSTATKPQDGQPSYPASNTSSSEQQEDTTEEAEPSEDSKTATSTALNEQKTTPSQSLVERSKSSVSNEGQVVKIDSVPPAANEKNESPSLDASLAVRVTRARSRRTRGALNR